MGQPASTRRVEAKVRPSLADVWNIDEIVAREMAARHHRPEEDNVLFTVTLPEGDYQDAGITQTFFGSVWTSKTKIRSATKEAIRVYAGYLIDPKTSRAVRDQQSPADSTSAVVYHVDCYHASEDTEGDMIALVGINNLRDPGSTREILEYGRFTPNGEDDVIFPQHHQQLACQERVGNPYRHITNGNDTKTYVKEKSPGDVRNTLSLMIDEYTVARIRIARQEQCPTF